MEKRVSTYRRKIEYISEKLGRLPTNLEDEFYVDALLYRLHSSIDAIMDIIAMLNKDLGLSLGDDYTNIENLKNAKVIDEKMAEELKRLNGLRNIIVHKYNKLDEKIVIESLDEILNIIFSFIEVVENAIQKIFK
ncbi:MAG: type VII toxin-antitoxin system HepT family RNase toxin [Candidatus Njordarchaeales archaeon]